MLYIILGTEAMRTAFFRMDNVSFSCISQGRRYWMVNGFTKSIISEKTGQSNVIKSNRKCKGPKAVVQIVYKVRGIKT